MKLRQAKPTDFEVFSPSHHDLLEAQAYGITPAFPPAELCTVVDFEGHPLAIGGNDGDQCWFVTSDQAWRLDLKSKLEFRRLIMTHRDKLLATFPVLWNFVWVGNQPHFRFLKSIGAVFHNEYSDESKTFQLFTIQRGA